MAFLPVICISLVTIILPAAAVQDYREKKIY